MEEARMAGSKVELPVVFIARARRRAKVLEITLPARLMKQLGIDHGTLIEVQINRILYPGQRKRG
jgi:CTP-dependent riboflavin kinase